jgi:NADPH-dependent ferric siderophore reductase
MTEHLHSTGGWVMDRITRSARVISIGRATPRMTNIRIAGPSLATLRWRPGQHLRVVTHSGPMLPALFRGTLRDQLRTYMVLAFDPDAQTLDLCVLERDEDTPAQRWLRGLAVGASVAFLGPEGRFGLREEAAYHLFVGEETAQVAVWAMSSALPPAARIVGAMEVADPGDQLPIPRGEELTWRYRGAAPAVASTGLLDAVRGLRLPDGPGAAYLAGEAKTCVAIRQFLIRERGWPARGGIQVKPFWTPGKRGLE